ncbi:hypothetical protein DMB92_01085 [Campylobacter sp. MIT 99-7217]|uniref:hypothetical protein n=1 Tax=Campylobacter sp. MIT 99-7217 TaxID=535091 RepID=UPI0011575F82|nr:hypothetical protein [Campylobacter sp. MIT 99-7217]TQR34588.1 hypothetical protein DMB92_01085 [Campylobacter sp. MIT 99-7217]
MIYFFEFLKGASWAFMLFGASYFFVINEFKLVFACFGALPGFALLIISFLLIENHELKEKISK